MRLRAGGDCTCRRRSRARPGTRLVRLRLFLFFFFSSRRRHTRCYRDWSSDVCSSDLMIRHTRCYRDWSSDVCSSDLTASPAQATISPGDGAHCAACGCSVSSKAGRESRTHRAPGARDSDADGHLPRALESMSVTSSIPLRTLLSVGLALATAAACAESAALPSGPIRPGSADAPREVNVILRDYLFEPTPIRLLRGETVRFNIVNGGLLPHDFVLGGAAVPAGWGSAEAIATHPILPAPAP